MPTLNDVADYIVVKTTVEGAPISHLKLQKLVYYVQAWHLALYDTPLFPGRFQAWVHGPVSRQLYDRFAATKSLYSSITTADLQTGFDLTSLPQEAQAHIDEVLEVYAKYTGSQLEDMTHREEPWLKARKGYAAGQRCENLIDEQVMKAYYAAQIVNP